MGRHGWRGWYGNEDAVDGEVFRKWRDAERERMKLVMRCKRADAKVRRRPGEPAYPERVLALLERWVDDHRNADPDAQMALEQMVDLMRRAARLSGLSEGDIDAIQDKGVAKYLRSLGIELRRRSYGMVVLGLWFQGLWFQGRPSPPVPREPI